MRTEWKVDSEVCMWLIHRPKISWLPYDDGSAVIYDRVTGVDLVHSDILADQYFYTVTEAGKTYLTQWYPRQDELPWRDDV